MKDRSHLCSVAARWLEKSGDLEMLRSALMVRSMLSHPPKVLKIPVHVNVMELREIDEKLAELVVGQPMEAQKVFHEVLHTVAVAISLHHKTQQHSPENCLTLPLPSLSIKHRENPIELPSSSGIEEEEDENKREEEHCLPRPLSYLPDINDDASLYADEDGKKHDHILQLCEGEDDKKRVDKKRVPIMVDKVDLNLTLQSLASDLPFDTSIVENREILTAAQIHAPMRVCGLPWEPGWVVRDVKDLPLHLTEPILSQISGRILSVSLPQPYTVWARYVCSHEECVGVSRELHVKVFTVGRPETDTLHHPPICRVCESALHEDPSSRELGERSTVLLLLDRQSHTFTRENPTRAQALRLELRDEMLQDVVPGQILVATVMIAPKPLPQLPCLEVITVHPPTPLRASSSLPPVFRQLASDRAMSPWSLVVTLAYMFASGVAPCGTFHTFKLALLLSLASCSSDKGLAVLVVGSNTTLLQRLLLYGARYAPHSIIHSSLDAVTATYTREVTPEGSGGSERIWVQAGSLLLAHGGVCVMGDFSKFRQSFRQKVCRALESGVVEVECTPCLRAQVPALKYPLQAAVWACYDPSHHIRSSSCSSDGSDENFLHVPLGDLTKSITDVFGLVVYAETPLGECENQAEEVITLHTLFDGTRPEPPPAPLLPPDQLRQFMAMVRSVNVVFSADAERLIRGYYVSTRRLRGDCVKGSAVPVTAIHTLAQVATSHARLALRTSVESWDAVAAVLLCEEALAAHYGYSPLNVTPQPHLPTQADLHTLLGRKNDERMKHFQKQLEDFITTHTGDIPASV